jgi:hypothetical protein
MSCSPPERLLLSYIVSRDPASSRLAGFLVGGSDAPHRASKVGRLPRETSLGGTDAVFAASKQATKRSRSCASWDRRTKPDGAATTRRGWQRASGARLLQAQRQVFSRRPPFIIATPFEPLCQNWTSGRIATTIHPAHRRIFLQRPTCRGPTSCRKSSP